MKLKIFFFPSALVVAVVMIIWYIWPAYQKNVALKQTLTQKQKQLSILQERKTLVDGLVAQINRDRSIKDFLFHYIPTMPDEEYIMDAVDDAAKRAGISLVIVDFVQGNAQSFFSGSAKDQSAKIKTVPGSDPMAVTQDLGDVAPQIMPPLTKEVTIDAVAIGPYDGMKKFLNEMYKIDRMHGVLSATLERVDAEKQDVNGLGKTFANGAEPNDTILGKMVVSFAYMPHVKVPRGADDSLFRQSMPAEKIRTMQAQYTAAPALVTENIGRQNPFVDAGNQKAEVVNDAAAPTGDAAPATAIE